MAFFDKLASHLRKPVAEIYDLSEEEVLGWAACLSAAQ